LVNMVFMMKRYTAAEIETARDYIGGHADSLPRADERTDAERMIEANQRTFEAMLAREEKRDAARARRAARMAAKAK